MKFIKVLAIAAISVALGAGPSAKSEVESKDDGEPFSILLVTSKDQFKGKIFYADRATNTITPGASQNTRELEEEQKKRDALARESIRQVNVLPVSPGMLSDPKAKIIMADTAYRDKYGRSNCVTFATRYSGIYKRLGYGVTIASEGNNPQVGAIALDRYRGHAAVIVAIEGRTLTLWDSNWIKGYVTERKVDISSQRGYIYR